MDDGMENTGTGMPEEHPSHEGMGPEELERHLNDPEAHPEGAPGGDVVPAPEDDDDMDMGGDTEPKPVDAPEDDEEAV